MKPFIITIDTEGDNLWNWRQGEAITTQNVKFLRRFQDLSNEYNYKPTWLCDWEMISDDSFVNFIKDYRSQCEVGMHLHAWNTPPRFDLCEYNQNCNPYLIEYPEDVMDEKIRCITEAFEDRLGYRPVSHRAGRWGINDKYFKLLNKNGYKFDCSITPGVNWTKSRGQTQNSVGPDYRNEKNTISLREGIIEIPLNTVRMNYVSIDKKLSADNCLKKTLKGMLGQHVYLRPGIFEIKVLLRMIEKMKKSDSTYLMFMIHSSELMAGGSPYFTSEESIESLYRDIRTIFDEVKNDYYGMTMEEYGTMVGKELV